MLVCQSSTSPQNEYALPKQTRKGLRQGDVLSTLLFNVVLEVIVRRANLQPGKPSSDTHDQIRKITLKTTTAKTTTFNRK
jgi:hypothetical protein